MNKVIIPFSGGMDSSTLLYLALKQDFESILLVFLSYNQKHEYKEFNSAKKLFDKVANLHKDIKFTTIEADNLFSSCTCSALINRDIKVAQAKDTMGDPQTVNYVPFRNQIILTFLCSLAEAQGFDTIYFGATKIDSMAGYWDASKEFIEAFNNTISLNRRNRIKVITPLIDKDKSDIIELGISCGLDYNDTWTCYEGEDEACGYCTACSLRIKGFIDYGIKDPISYKRKIDWNNLLNNK